MFTPGSRHAAGAPCTTSVERLAELDLPTGRIIACDALVGSRGAPAFTRTVPPGRYPVDACIAQIEPGHVRIAAVVIMHSGWGDGIYDSTWGLDADGQPVWLVTDFRVMTAPHRESADRVA
jgi:hypothetical protein